MDLCVGPKSAANWAVGSFVGISAIMWYVFFLSQFPAHVSLHPRPCLPSFLVPLLPTSHHISNPLHNPPRPASRRSRSYSGKTAAAPAQRNSPRWHSSKNVSPIDTSASSSGGIALNREISKVVGTLRKISYREALDGIICMVMA